MHQSSRDAPESLADLLATTLVREEPARELYPTVPGYELYGELGRGGTGIVLKARQKSLDRLVALKMLPVTGADTDEAAAQRFEREVHAIASTQHPNIVQIFEVGATTGWRYFSMELLEGGTLAGKIQGRPQDTLESVKLLRTISQAVDIAHKQGLIHRDLKPNNILLTTTGIPKVADFGLAKEFGAGTEATCTGQIVGTPTYMAPEQASGQVNALTPTVDVHALGVILYEMLTGRPPFVGATMLLTLEAIRTQDPVPLRTLVPGVPRDLETICHKCLHKVPAARYASAGDLAADLERLLTHQPILARPVGWIGKFGRWCRRNPGRASTLISSTLAGLTLLAVWGSFTLRLNHALIRTENARLAAFKMQQQMRLNLVREVANRIDSDLQQIAAVPEGIATLLCATDLEKAHLEGWLERLLAGEPKLIGIGIAFEPNAFREGQAEFAPYAYVSGGKIVTGQMDLANYRKRDWYRLAAGNRKPIWTEPYIGNAPVEVPMVSYGVPIVRENRLLGVVCADLPLTYFQFMREHLPSTFHTQRERFSYVVTPKGTILVDHQKEMAYPDARSKIALVPFGKELLREEPAFQTIESGMCQIHDSKPPMTLLYARIESAGWSLVVGLPETAALK